MWTQAISCVNDCFDVFVALLNAGLLDVMNWRLCTADEVLNTSTKVMLDRDLCLGQVRDHVARCFGPLDAANMRRPVCVISGFPGTGKTLLLSKAGQDAAAKQGNCAFVVVTFNSKTPVYTDNDAVLHQVNPELPLIARVIFYHLHRNSTQLASRVWSTFLADFAKLTLDARMNAILKQLTCNTVLHLLRLVSRIPKLIFGIDEVLMLRSKLINYHDQDVAKMMAVYRDQDNSESSLAVIVSALASGFLNQEQSDTGRVIDRIGLQQLHFDCAVLGIKHRFSSVGMPILASLCASVGVCGEGCDHLGAIKVIAKVIGGLPRALDAVSNVCQLEQFRTRTSALVPDTLRFSAPGSVSFASFLDSLALEVQTLYQTICSTMGTGFLCEGLRKDGLLSMDSEVAFGKSVRDALSEGLLAATGVYDNLTMAEVVFPQALLLAFATSNALNLSQDIQSPLKTLVMLPVYRPRDMFEAFIRQALILKIAVHYHTRKNVESNFELTLKELFRPCVKTMSCPIGDQKVILLPMQWETARFVNPPTPDEILCHYHLHKRLPLGEPESTTAPGYDEILYLFCSGTNLKNPQASDLICCGLQMRWSHDDEQRLSAVEIAEAQKYFRMQMESCGWQPKQLAFVILAWRSLPSHFYPLTDRSLRAPFVVGLEVDEGTMSGKWKDAFRMENTFAVTLDEFHVEVSVDTFQAKKNVRKQMDDTRAAAACKRAESFDESSSRRMLRANVGPQNYNEIVERSMRPTLIKSNRLRSWLGPTLYQLVPLVHDCSYSLTPQMQIHQDERRSSLSAYKEFVANVIAQMKALRLTTK